MRTNNKFPIALFKEIIHILGTVFKSDKVIDNVFEYARWGSVSHKLTACKFALNAIEVEAKIYPNRKLYRNVKNLFDKNNVKSCGHHGNYVNGQWTTRELTFCYNKSWGDLVEFCIDMKKYLGSDPAFVEFGNWIEQEYDELKYIGEL